MESELRTEELRTENEALRARITELERGTGVDPLMLALLAHAVEFVNVVSPEGRFLATGRTSESFGSVVGRSIYEFCEAEAHEIMRAALATVCATGETQWYESTGYGEDGTPGHVYRVRAVPLGAPGAVTAIVLVPTDITDHVKLERAVRESQEALRLAIDATGMGLWRWHISENKVEWDRRITEIFGLAETPPTYEAYREHLHPDDRAKVELAIRHALETGQYPPLEHRLVPDADGRVRHVLAVGTVIKDASGKPTVLMGGALDISEQKRMEAQVSRAIRVEAVGQLTAGIAHNFNNLLTVIIPSLELSMLEASPNTRPQLDAALEAALQARDLVSSLLSLTRGKSTSQDGAVDPKEVVARVEAICRATFPREIRLSWRVDRSLGAVAMSATELEQVLLNLLFNARDALEHVEPTHERQVSVVVERSRHAGSPWVRVRVVDNGPGMTEAVRARVFEPFFTTKPPHRGSGLGLSNALLRVREAGGELECTSSFGGGATFELVLPEVEAPSSAEQPPKRPTAASRGETVLVVDDEPLVRASLRHLLTLEGYVVVEAGSAADARAVLASGAGAAVRLIILDQSMPAQSGSDAVPTLRSLSSAPIILFSGMLHERPHGVTAVLEKPARAAELWRTVRDVIDGAAG
ncbi:MAG: hypothetical protein JWM74_3356 [Myxococcaceae bacterium]|nr:hypothetical protein [Myxococcaceae bacterium]